MLAFSFSECRRGKRAYSPITPAVSLFYNKEGPKKSPSVYFCCRVDARPSGMPYTEYGYFI